MNSDDFLVPSPTRDLGQECLTVGEAQVIAAFGAAICAIGKTDEFTVVDLGGYTGSHYALISASFPDINFRWTIIELPEVVDNLKRFATHKCDWDTDLEHALSFRPNMVLASASLNYVEDPVSTLRLISRSAQFTLLTRLPLWPISEHKPAIQFPERRNRLSSYPTWFFSRALIISQLLEEGTIEMQFRVAGDRAYFADFYNYYSGLLFRKKG